MAAVVAIAVRSDDERPTILSFNLCGNACPDGDYGIAVVTRMPPVARFDVALPNPSDDTE